MCRLSRIAPAVFLFALASPAAGQITIGTDPDAPGEGWGLYDEAWVAQTFTVPPNATFLHYLYIGANITDDPCLYTSFTMGRGAAANDHFILGDDGMPPGPLAFGFGRTLPVTPGEILWFSLIGGDNWSPADEGNPCVETPFREPSGVYIATVDTYLGGEMVNHPGWDVQFSATFTTTPEPMSMALLATGLVGIGVVGWRRKRAAGV